MKTCTSAEANKLLKKLQDELNQVKTLETKASVFNAAAGEDVEELRPKYDYEATQKKLDEIEATIVRVKHAINVFNCTTEVPDFGFTIDQALVYLPQLSARKTKLLGMSTALERERTGNTWDKYIDYRITNYPIDKAKEDFNTVSDELSKLQMGLDKVNSTQVMVIDID